MATPRRIRVIPATQVTASARSSSAGRSAHCIAQPQRQTAIWATAVPPPTIAAGSTANPLRAFAFQDGYASPPVCRSSGHQGHMTPPPPRMAFSPSGNPCHASVVDPLAVAADLAAIPGRHTRRSVPSPAFHRHGLEMPQQAAVPSRTRSLTPVRTELHVCPLRRPLSVEQLPTAAHGLVVPQVEFASRLPAFGSAAEAPRPTEIGGLQEDSCGVPTAQSRKVEVAPTPSGRHVHADGMQRGDAGDAQQLPMTVVDEQAELAEGVVLTIGDQVCRITEPIGVGSFGVVWAGECAGFGQVAVKEIVCHSHTDFARAMYEAELLWVLTKKRSEQLGHDLQIPAFVSAEVATISPDMYRARLAMARVPGVPLDKFLRKEQQEMEAAANVYEARIAQLDKACSYAREIVLQLAPTMERIADLAYHRDVNAHNILISVESEEKSTKPSYGLVDFGLAVDAFKWQGGLVPCSADYPAGLLPGEREWEHLDVGGDCRYWPTSAWKQFEVGCQELAQERALCSEYQTHLDFQGLGITALQVLADMIPASTEQSHASVFAKFSSSRRQTLAVGEDVVLHSCGVLKAAWHDYWVTSSHYWSALLDTFRNNGDWNALKMEFISIGVHKKIASALHAVRKTLKETLDLCSKENSQVPFLKDLASLLSSLLVMISSGEERSALCTWQDVIRALRTDSSKPAVAPRRVRPPQEASSDAAASGHDALASTPSFAASGHDMPLGQQVASSSTPPRWMHQGSWKSLGNSSSSSPELIEQQPPRAPLLRTRGCRDGESSPSAQSPPEAPLRAPDKRTSAAATGGRVTTPQRRRSPEARRPPSAPRCPQQRASERGRIGPDQMVRKARAQIAGKTRQAKHGSQKDSKALLDQLNTLVNKVVHLAHRMEELETQDERNGLGLAAAARERFDVRAARTPVAQAAN